MKQDLRHDLRGLLERFQPRDDRDRRDLRRMQELADVEGDPFSRHHFRPGHFTASAWILSPDRREVLMVLHRKLGLWLQPGGHVDATDPSVLAAARREAREETGVSLDSSSGSARLFDIDVHRIPAHGAEPEHEHFDLRFLLQAASLALVIDAEVRDARWVPLTAVDALGTDESVRRMVALSASRRG